jgi:hypothetical protein
VDANLMERVTKGPVRGAVEHHYRATLLPVVTDEQKAELSGASTWNRSSPSTPAAGVQLPGAGTFLSRDGRYLTRYTFNIDEEGWAEATAAHMELYGASTRSREPPKRE